MITVASSLWGNGILKQEMNIRMKAEDMYGLQVTTVLKIIHAILKYWIGYLFLRAAKPKYNKINNLNITFPSKETLCFPN